MAGGIARPEPLRLWPSRNLDALARRNVMIRGQTPELHRALAEAVVTEGAATTLRQALEEHSDLLHDASASAVLDGLASARSRLDAVDLARAVLQRVDLDGALPQVVAALAAGHPDGPLASISTLFGQLNRRWTWPPDPKS